MFAIVTHYLVSLEKDIERKRCERMKQLNSKAVKILLDKLAEEYKPFQKHGFLGAWAWTIYQERKYKCELWKQGVKIVDEFVYEEVKAGLEKSKATVVFEKVDGSLREMHCTLMAEYLPPMDETHSNVAKAVNEEVLAVWDLDKNAWRSFRLDSLISIDYK